MTVSGEILEEPNSNNTAKEINNIHGKMMNETSTERNVIQLLGANNEDLKRQVKSFLLQSNIPQCFLCIMKLNWENESKLSQQLKTGPDARSYTELTFNSCGNQRLEGRLQLYIWMLIWIL